MDAKNEEKKERNGESEIYCRRKEGRTREIRKQQRNILMKENWMLRTRKRNEERRWRKIY